MDILETLRWVGSVIGLVVGGGLIVTALVFRVSIGAAGWVISVLMVGGAAAFIVPKLLGAE